MPQRRRCKSLSVSVKTVCVCEKERKRIARGKLKIACRGWGEKELNWIKDTKEQKRNKDERIID